MRNNNEIMQEVLNRANKMEKKKEMRNIQIATGITGFCSFVVVIGIAVAMSVWIKTAEFTAEEGNSAVGSLLGHSNLTGYVVVGVISFVIGVAMGMLWYYWRKKFYRG